jgi:hypothetical protein
MDIIACDLSWFSSLRLLYLIGGYAVAIDTEVSCDLGSTEFGSKYCYKY